MPKMIKPEDFDIWLDNLNFAGKKNNKKFQRRVVELIVEGIFCNVARAFLDCKKGLNHLANLLHSLDRIACLYCVGNNVAAANSKTFTGLVILYKVHLEEIIGKHNGGYEWFYESFVRDML